VKAKAALEVAGCSLLSEWLSSSVASRSIVARSGATPSAQARRRARAWAVPSASTSLGSEAIRSITLLDEHSDTEVFDVAVADRSTSSPTGSPTRANLRAETPASIRSITALVSGSRSAKYS